MASFPSFIPQFYFKLRVFLFSFLTLFLFCLNNLVSLLDGVANTGVVELSDVKLAAYLAEKKSNGQPFFRNGKTS